MKASTQEVMNFAKVSQSTAIELSWNNLHTKHKLYTDRGNNARVTINWLSKKFGITNFVKGNDAPKGGKNGNFVTFEPTEAFKDFTQSILDFDAQKEIEHQESIANFEKMKLMAKEFIQANPEKVEKYKAKHGTNSKGLQIAAWKLSNIANGKGLKISKTAFHHAL